MTNPNTRSQVSKVTIPVLQEQLKALGVSTSGKKKALQKRLKKAKSVQREVSPANSVEIASTGAEMTTTFSVCDQLDLDSRTRDILAENGFPNGKDLHLLTQADDYPANLSFIPIMRDRLAVQGFLRPKVLMVLPKDAPGNKEIQRASETQPVDLREVLNAKRDRGESSKETSQLRHVIMNKREETTEEDHDDSFSDSSAMESIRSGHRHHTKHRRHRHCSSGESTDDSDDEASLSRLPQKARNLPRPHKLICSKRGLGSNKGPKATTLSIEEFFAESSRLAERLARQTDNTHAAVLQEYLGYLEYLQRRRLYYSDVAILQFDDEFRRTAKAEKFGLGPSEERSAIADRHFFEGVSRKKPKTESSRNSQPFRSERSTTSAKEYKHHCCHNWNRNACKKTRNCYPHLCGHCGDKNHRATDCPTGASA